MKKGDEWNNDDTQKIRALRILNRADDYNWKIWTFWLTQFEWQKDDFWKDGKTAPTDTKSYLII